MSGLIEISDTASDLAPDIRGDSEPLPTTITTQSYMVMSDWPSSHKETLLQWFLLRTFQSQSERRRSGQWTVSSPRISILNMPFERPKRYMLVEGKATDVTPGIVGESDTPGQSTSYGLSPYKRRSDPVSLGRRSIPRVHTRQSLPSLDGGDEGPSPIA